MRNAKLHAAAPQLADALIAILRAYSVDPEEGPRAEMMALGEGCRALKAAGIIPPPLVATGGSRGKKVPMQEASEKPQPHGDE